MMESKPYSPNCVGITMTQSGGCAAYERQHDAGLGQQLLDLDLQRRVSPLVALASRDHALSLPDKSLSQLWQPIPESKRDTGSRHTRRYRNGAITKNCLCADEETETQR